MRRPAGGAAPGAPPPRRHRARPGRRRRPAAAAAAAPQPAAPPPAAAAGRSPLAAARRRSSGCALLAAAHRASSSAVTSSVTPAAGSCRSSSRSASRRPPRSRSARLSVLRRELAQGGPAARAHAALGQVGSVAVGVQGIRQLADPARRGHRRDRQHRHLRGSDRGQRLSQVAPRAGGGIAEVGLRDHQQIRHLHDPRLQELEDVPGRGLHHHGHVSQTSSTSVSDWPTPTVSTTTTSKAGASASAASRVAAARPPSRPARGGRADQHAVVARIVVDAGAVAEQRAAGALGRGIDGEDGDGPPVVCATP